jgi:hypothetical protein
VPEAALVTVTSSDVLLGEKVPVPVHAKVSGAVPVGLMLRESELPAQIGELLLILPATGAVQVTQFPKDT